LGALRGENPFESLEHTIGSPKRRKHETHDLNSSSITRSKLCKEMDKKLEKTSNLKEAFLTTTT
jgi:c-di-GMP-related signal transduction protein